MLPCAFIISVLLAFCHYYYLYVLSDSLLSTNFSFFVFFFPVQNIDNDMLAISFLLVAIEDLCHGIHIFQAQNGGFCDPIILLSHVVKIFHSMQSVCGHYSILVLLFNIILLFPIVITIIVIVISPL